MGMQLNTGDTGRTVLASADGSLYSKIFGSGCFVLAGGNELKAEIQSNNLIKIYDGDLIMQGRHVYIPASDSDTVTINNGSQGMNRKDLIVARYTKTSDGTEDVVLAVIQGTATEGTVVAPEYVEGDILTGATAKDFPLYEVTLSGINITSVTKKFSVLGADLSDVSALESKMSALGNYTPMLPLRGYSGNMNNMPTGTFLCELAKCTNAPSYPMGMWAHVICYAGFSQTAIFYNGSNYPPVIATRTYANNAWTSWAEQAQGFDFASVRFNGLVDNALAVDLTNPYAEMNKPRYVDRAKSATNMPTDCQWGIREVCQITNNWVMVRITGWTTNSHHAIWTNVYVSSKWYGWTKHSYGVDTLTQSGLSINSGRCKIISGGYYVQNKIAHVQMKIQALTALSSRNYWVMIRGFPQPATESALAITKYNALGKSVGCYVQKSLSVSSGEIVITTAGDSIDANEYYVISGDYVVA